MLNDNVIAIDLAKSTFHVCVLNKQNNVTIERKFTRTGLSAWLAKQPLSTVAVESCGSAHHWGRLAKQYGHQAKLFSPKFVAPYRQGHKTDTNDALAIAITAKQPQMKSVAVKTIEQQGLQAIERMRQHHSDAKTALSNMLRGLIFEFGMTIPRGDAALKKEIPSILEDAENELPLAFRDQFFDLYQFFLKTEEALVKVEHTLTSLIQANTDCQALMEIEGIGPVNALGLSLVLGEQGKSFKNGREASACIGLTPKQYSTGGVVRLGGIGKKAGNKRLRSTLIQGAMSVIRQLQLREPKTTKELWVKQLMHRSSLPKAAVALANKNIRTAWAVLNHGIAYQQPQKLVT